MGVLAFWRNPEFIRYRRANLRSARALGLASVIVVACCLFAFLFWTISKVDRGSAYPAFYSLIVSLQAALLALSSLGCGFALFSERSNKTSDFLRTTRLSAAELLVGKLLGAPISAYFAVAVSLPFSVTAGLLAGHAPLVLLATYGLIVVFALTLGLAALCGALHMDTGYRGLAVAWFMFLYMAAIVAMNAGETAFPGLAALNPLLPILSLYPGTGMEVLVDRLLLFGSPVNPIAMSLVLYLSLGAWFVLVLVRNIKREVEEIRSLASWQAVVFAAYVNLMLYGLLDAREIRPNTLAILVVVLNAGIMVAVGLATLTSKERLRVWWRMLRKDEATHLSENGLPWPWMTFAAFVALAMFAVARQLLHGAGSDGKLLSWVGFGMLLFLLFSVRDILFLQFCSLTGMRRPLLSGFLFLVLYYVAAGILAAIVAMTSAMAGGAVLVALLTPAVFFAGPDNQNVWVILGGGFLHVMFIAVLLYVIIARLNRYLVPTTATPR